MAQDPPPHMECTTPEAAQSCPCARNSLQYPMPFTLKWILLCINAPPMSTSVNTDWGASRHLRWGWIQNLIFSHLPKQSPTHQEKAVAQGEAGEHFLFMQWQLSMQPEASTKLGQLHLTYVLLPHCPPLWSLSQSCASNKTQTHTTGHSMHPFIHFA